MASPFDEMSDEQLLAMIRETSKAQGTETGGGAPAEKFRVALADGSVIEGETQEALNTAIQKKLEDSIRAAKPADTKPVTTSGNAPAPVQWDMKTFTEKFVNDPAEGLEFLETAKYGMPVGKAVPQMLAMTMALAQKVQELETASFAPKVDEERVAVQQIMQERNWQPSKQSFQDALDIAKGRGMLASKKEESKLADPFIPPRTRRSATTDNLDANHDEIINAAQTMPLEKLEEFLAKQGMITGRHT